MFLSFLFIVLSSKKNKETKIRVFIEKYKMYLKNQYDIIFIFKKTNKLIVIKIYFKNVIY